MAFPTSATYRAWCGYVVDGDTFDVLIDLGVNHYAYEAIRLKGVDCWEITGEERPRGVQAKAFTESEILGRPVMLVTYKDTQTFGRYVADCYYWDQFDVIRNLAAELRVAGHVKEG